MIDAGLQFQSGNFLSIGIGQWMIVFVHHMQDDVVIIRIPFMAVFLPIGRPDMNFYFSSPKLSFDSKSGIHKIGTLIIVKCPRFDYLQ
jgi:hypothetical protein